MSFIDPAIKSYLNKQIGTDLNWDIREAVSGETLFVTDGQSPDNLQKYKDIIERIWPGISLDDQDASTGPVGKRILMGKADFIKYSKYEETPKVTQAFSAVIGQSEKEKASLEVETKLAAASESTPLSKKIEALADTLCILTEIRGKNVLTKIVSKQDAQIRKSRVGFRGTITTGKENIYNRMKQGKYISGSSDPKALEFYELCKQEILLSFNKEAAKKELESQGEFWKDFDARDLAYLQKQDTGNYWFKQGAKENTYEFCILKGVHGTPKFVQSYVLELTDKGFKFEDKCFPNIHENFRNEIGTKDVHFPGGINCIPHRALFKS
jgi:hypothetical protein